jgi:hypothetical protein
LEDGGGGGDGVAVVVVVGGGEVTGTVVGGGCLTGRCLTGGVGFVRPTGLAFGPVARPTDVTGAENATDGTTAGVTAEAA